MCVHTPAVGVLLSHFLFDGLAEHVLINLAVRWGNKSFSTDMTNDEYDIRNQMCKLLSIVSIDSFHRCKDTLSISDLLQDMKVGTDVGKGVPLPPPINYKYKPFKQSYQPFRKMKIENPSTKALAKVKNILDDDGLQKRSPTNDQQDMTPSTTSCTTTSTNTTTSSKTTTTSNATNVSTCPRNETNSEPDYTNILMCIKALINVNTHPCEFIRKRNDSTDILNQNYIGYKLLHLRHMKKLTTTNNFNEDICITQHTQQWHKVLSPSSLLRKKNHVIHQQF